MQSTSANPDATTLPAAFQATAAAHAEAPAFTADGETVLTWREYADRVRSIAGGLAGLGIGHGGTVALMLTNRLEFHLYDTAAMHLGAVPHSVYNTYAPEQIAYQLEDAGSDVVVTEAAFAEPVLAAGDRKIVVVDGEGGISPVELEAGAPDGFDFDAAWQALEPDDLVTLIYTSGTTGPPKGVQLTHSNVLTLIRSLDEVINFPAGGRVISWLPMAHIAERACSHYFPIVFGFTTTCCPDPRQIVAYLPQVNPTWFFAPPRIWEKLKAALEADPNVTAAIEGENGEILAAVRAKIGLDQVRSAHIGAAPCPPEVIEFFHALGVPLAEVWGLSEGSGLGTVNPPERVKISTVGPPIPGVELKLAEDGEVLLRGPLNMAGYRNQPEQTAETIDPDGWLHTGDVGALDEDGYLSIVDRKKELIINAGGKNMSPANIEAKLKAASPLIGQAIAIGDRRPYNVALITLDPEAAPGFPDAEGEVAAGVERANARLARVEQIKRFKVLPGEWTADSDELTPTLKLKRKPITEKYADEIEALYG